MNWRSVLLMLAATAFLVTVMAYFSGAFTENAANPGSDPEPLDGTRITLAAETIEVVEPDLTLEGLRILAETL